MAAVQSMVFFKKGVACHKWLRVHLSMWGPSLLRQKLSKRPSPTTKGPLCGPGYLFNKKNMLPCCWMVLDVCSSIVAFPGMSLKDFNYRHLKIHKITNYTCPRR